MNIPHVKIERRVFHPINACPPPFPQAHPLVHFIYVQMLNERMSRAEVARRAGLAVATMISWWKAPNKKGKGGIAIQNLEAALGVFGYALKPTPLQDQTIAPPKRKRKTGPQKNFTLIPLEKLP
jgi:hypothetical protein